MHSLLLLQLWQLLFAHTHNALNSAGLLCLIFPRALARFLQSTTTTTTTMTAAAAAVQIKEEHVFWVPRWWRWRRLLGCLPALAVNWKLIGGVTSLLFFILFRKGENGAKKCIIYSRNRKVRSRWLAAAKFSRKLRVFFFLRIGWDANPTISEDQ